MSDGPERPRRDAPSAGDSEPSRSLPTRLERTSPRPDVRSIELPDRYLDLGRIARGGWGEIRRAHDRVMDRVVVVKLLASEHLDSPRVLGRFLNEATITASLEHPGIVPVHDRGELSDGRPWFTMKEVRGKTLAAALHEERRADDPAWLRRAIETFARVCETVGYAHERNVVHRDLKPGNVMIGEHGEVLVLDWGVARRRGEPVPREGGEVRSSREAGDVPSGREPQGPDSDTQAGDLLGTIEYMSPEQARGANELVDPTSDVYALGLVLFEILTGSRARSGLRMRAWVEAAGAVVPALTGEERSIPAELREVYARATQAAPRDRHSNGRDLADAVRAWLDGAARRERAARAVATSDALVAEIDRLRGERDALRARAARLLAALHPHDPVEQKIPAWRLEDEAGEIERRLAVVETERIDALSAALEHDTENLPAHARLATIYRARLIEAEARGERADASRWEILLRRHDRGEHARFLAGLGRVALASDPVGATVRVLRCVVRDRRIVTEDTGIAVTAPFDLELPAGSYVLLFEHPERAPARHPVRVARDESWPATRPGDAGPTPVRLLESLAAGEVYVPAGWADVGGDPTAAEPVAAQRIWIDGIVMQRFPVTCGEYLAFLDDLAASAGEERSLRYAPRWPRGASSEEPLAVRRVAGRFELLPDEHGRPVDPSWPIQSIDWHSAHAYAEWLAARTGLPWRLPNELEWEKAARGVDQRAYPWGAQPEATWARMLGSTIEAPCRAPVDSYPVDESPYGARGLAGNVRDWCANAWTVEGPRADAGLLRIEPADPGDPAIRTIKGGAWNSVPAFARAAGRFATKPDERFSAVGFRLVRSVDPARGAQPAR